MPVVERAGGQQEESDKSGERAADAPAEAPGHEQADEADGGADEPPRREQAERQNFRRERGKEIEAAAIHVDIDEG